MSDQPFHDPHVRLSRIYTKTGDEGQTRLVGGQRVDKHHPRIETYGTTDELNAFVGLARVTAEESGGAVAALGPILLRVQHELFNLGSQLATLPEDLHPRQPRITADDVTRLEEEIDRFNEPLGALRSFVLPGGTRLNAELHACRTICRRAERLLVALAAVQSVPPEALHYLNRLSDAFFVWSRWACHATGTAEVLWQPNQPHVPGLSDTEK